ncbi:DUF4276 family protein [Ralstonia pseudosolanacearum]|uniref:DUF4276 family protein n=1 Tax=Ralstonia pseudosolanacearum TaxID=1310165 RepID=UPI0018D17CC5|nr:DUF4276 family protein [Ralstonia pseudosolanacearum]UWD90693.1 DUF4276 family protein [Ralstonia pseudosolanacearum]CAH0442165.1 hypothetical protein LMG9673_02977 [Ralstonia pseudosolanacearum]
MIEIIVIGEGATEETFVRDVFAPYLALNNVFATARLIQTGSGGQKGGALSFERVARSLSNTLKKRANTYVTTLFDLYGLKPEFPGFEDSRRLAEPAARSAFLETALHQAIVTRAGCRHERFLPHIQPHEFEALLFSDIPALCSIEPDWAKHEALLTLEANRYPNPEWINDSPQTAPSKRLAALSPTYGKVRHGALAAQSIGLDAMRARCPHFAGWVSRLLALTPLAAE